MQDDREQQIRDRAYSIWEEQGRPQGEDMRHWLQAWQEISNADIPAEDANAMTLPDSAEATIKKPAAASARHGNGATQPKASRKKKS
ncbi:MULTISPECIES: DUF2934 domain-containing protein [unclassified Rhizobium]|uniref:DUF2934 domain-containing protein n=1 Tax=unclassified Rhizobium TaxID=2613769 RepID=UPI001ADA79F0|nr:MULTISPECIES: DUF2934 domain-containing protein [unclassified Rhizobium]MBO9097057.1 DUF2934 domain-containing protein [Rhizobium sp. L58/93]MBO9134091.1 DUF2934 domain-containing protein [Rhizobium sp. B209b/85]MBO9167295.1 DUF2934 domain-containing protein [Rhizobium sp. L245/93]MBO9183254.1 DUF2934 domain-containing protein [Rhizobium sp. E27B/91]QXZ83598.1 DUF2934 domain-containing protein [Rhizobium sp. K1/93]